MTQFIVKDTSNGNTRMCDSRAEAEETRDDLISLGANPEELVVESGEGEERANVTDDGTVVQQGGKPQSSGEEIDAEVIDHTEDADPSEPDETAPAPVQEPQDDIEALDELGESLETDPLSILPGHMIDHIQGQPAINKRGYAMIAERYGVSVKAYIESYPWENEDKRCVARAVATTDDGKEYQDYATANTDDGDMSDQLIELASTRALKRVTGWATGLGIVSYVELSNQLEQ